jgi:hypothetical protein
VKGMGLLVQPVHVPVRWRVRCWAAGGGGRGCVQNRRRGYLTCIAHALVERYARAEYFAGQWPDLEGMQRPADGECRGCGCSELRACAFGCAWVEVDLCSACVPPEELGALVRLASTDEAPRPRRRRRLYHPDKVRRAAAR